MGSKLSHCLLDKGFFCVLGTTEHVGGGGRGLIVKRGTPWTCDYNNGVSVFYDEEGRPWIKHGATAIYWNDGKGGDRITQGAYVPHSNDGGHFVHEVLPNL